LTLLKTGLGASGKIRRYRDEILSAAEPKPKLCIEKIGLWSSFVKQEVGPALRGVKMVCVHPATTEPFRAEGSSAADRLAAAFPWSHLRSFTVLIMPSRHAFLRVREIHYAVDC